MFDCDLLRKFQEILNKYGIFFPKSHFFASVFMFNYVKGQSAIMNIVTHEGYKGNNTKDAINHATRDCHFDKLLHKTNQKRPNYTYST